VPEVTSPHSINTSQVINTLTNFANITLSSLYFDISKDSLYANDIASFERRATVTVLEQVLKTMTSVLAPVLPHLAEEIHVTFKGDGTSVFMTPWAPLVCAVNRSHSFCFHLFPRATNGGTFKLRKTCPSCSEFVVLFFPC